MSSTGLLAIYLILFASRFANVICDGDHAHDHAPHAHDNSASSSSASSDTHSSTGPSGATTSTTVHTTSEGDGSQDSFSSILSGLSPELIGSLAQNPQIAQALRGSGVDGDAASAAKAAAQAGGRVGGGAGFPGGLPGGFPGGLGGLGGLGGGFGGLPFSPFFGPGFGKHLSVDADFGVFFPIIKKVIIIIGGGILILVILALLAKGFAKGGLLSSMGSSFAEALAGSASIDLGPFHKSVAGAGAVSGGVGAGQARPFGNSPQDMQLNQNVQNSLDQRF